METVSMDNNQHVWTHEVEKKASNSKANTALGIGIGALGLGLLNTLGGSMAMWNANCNRDWNRDGNGRRYDETGRGITNEEAFIERSVAQTYIDMTKEHYKGRLENQKQLADAFFDAYKRDVDNSFGLYKSQRDGFDITNQKLTDAAFGLYKNQRDGFDVLNQKMIDSSFGLYKNQRDNKDEIMSTIWAGDAKINQKVGDYAFNLYKNERDDKDALNCKINQLEKKIDVMAAVRPYQDALINAKIDKNALISDYNLSKRTCRMIEGQLVLPDNIVSGFTSYDLRCNG